MHRMSTALLERETLDAAEIKLIIEGKDLPDARSPLSAVDPGPGGDVQKVLKPETRPQARLRRRPAQPRLTLNRCPVIAASQRRQPHGCASLCP